MHPGTHRSRDWDQAALITTDRVNEQQQDTVGWHEAGVTQAIKSRLSLKVAAVSG